MITAVFTSCGRMDLLRDTVQSFISYKMYPIEKYIVIDNSTNQGLYPLIQEMFDGVENVEIIINETNIGQVASIDKAYEKIETEYIFHCEDDWEFFEFGFIEKSLDVLKSRLDISNINLRLRNDGTKGSYHPINPIEYKTDNGTIYHEYIQNYLGEWHGFSWNPGLRRLNDYKSIKPYKKYYNEQGVNNKMKELGFKAACLEDCYCKHIGEGSFTPKSNS